MKNKGFTLVELAIVLTIGGMIIASTTTVLLNYLRQSHIEETNQRLQKIDLAIKQFLRVNNRLPCAAVLTNLPDTADFGVEVANCDSSTPAGTERLTAKSAFVTNKNVKIGTVPVRSLNLPDSEMFDGWGNRFYYAVTETLATEGKFEEKEGRISITDGTYDVQLPPGTAQYVVISMGENAKGAYNMNGAVPKACPNNTYFEHLNCRTSLAQSGDAEFHYSNMISTNTGLMAFDDLMIYDAMAAPIPVSNNLPAGTIIPFARDTCPPDWITAPDLAGRVIIGSGAYGSDPVTSNCCSASDYAVGNMGGFAGWVFNVEELPSHYHEQQLRGLKPGPQEATTVGGLLTPYGAYTPPYTGSAGGTPPNKVENRQPYYALLYCQKL